MGKKQLGEAFTPGSHGTTFGGNMLAMAAVNATLQIVFQPDFLQEAADKGAFLKGQLEAELKSPFVKQIRGKGLMLGIECDGYGIADIISELQTLGLLVLLTFYSNVIRLLPPLTVTKDEIAEAVSKLKQAIAHHSAVNQ
nr:aminotransferase class III-fold pyridoxal phosphate-dependent enzyme [Bacillus subtilis]